jgi:serine protease Do
MATSRSAAAVRLAAGLGMALVVAACAGSASPAATPAATTAPPATATPSVTVTPSASASIAASASPAGVGTLEDVRAATIQIEADGSFVDPTQGQMLNSAGRGSGFLVGNDGVAVTANHVVTGAALLKVWVGGDRNKTYNARILGVSECSDLAVIQLDGSGFTSLAWGTDAPRVGTDVYAAGFPLGDPEYTLTRGIVSKAKADGETSWSSVDSVIETDALINPGNSGGPLVTKDGHVIGVNYAGNQANQSFAIGYAEAQKVLAKLTAGQDVTSIGVNGEAMKFDDGTSGIFVSSVASGSPADNVGIKGGDVITKLEGLVLSTDGTMSDYCDILRSHGSTDVLAVEVYRPSTGQTLGGRLNGTPLAVVSTIQTGSDQGGNQGDAAAAYSYKPISANGGGITLELPTAWSDLKSGQWKDGSNVIGYRVGASSDYAAWVKGFDTPGLFLGVSSTLADTSADTYLDLDKEYFSGECTYDGRKDFDFGGYTGRFDVYRKCGGTQNSFLQVAVKPADSSSFVLVQFVAVGDRDYAAADHAIETLKVTGQLP